MEIKSLKDTSLEDSIELNNIGQEMAVQNNRATQFPLFIVMEKVKEYGPYGDWGYDTSERNHDYDGPVCDECETNYADGNGADYPDEYGNCECEVECFHFYKEVDTPNLNSGVFFTSKACKEHIEANHYHYHKPFSFGIGCYGNKEMPVVMREIIRGSGAVVPSHYL